MSADGTVTDATSRPRPELEPPVPSPPASPEEAAINRAIAALDVQALAREFHDQDEFIFVPRFLPADLVEAMQAEYRSFSREEIHRVYVPFFRKAGTVGQRGIAEKAPFLYALYRAPAMLELTRRLTGTPLELKNDVDAHAAALYVYDRGGDHVGFHYDDCGCEGTSSYTATFGILNRTDSRVHFQLHLKDRARPMQEHHVAMTDGSFVFFCGAKAHHRVTPIAKGDERVAFSFAYVREGKRLHGYRRFRENVKDAILYFGPKAIFQKNYK